MNILMLTNTYIPFVGGVSRSVESFAREYRRRGHRTVVIAPAYENIPPDEVDIIRVPAIQHFNGTDFSVRLPIPGIVSEALEGFMPDIVHAHHPYLLGDTALRIAAKHDVPIVFTNHTLYERYTHYVAGDSPLLRRFVMSLAAGYANLCDRVFAPSASIALLLRDRGVEAPIAVIPSGVDIAQFASAGCSHLRKRAGIPNDAFVVGFVSRIAPEKNVLFLAASVAEFMRREKNAHFLIVGEGSAQAEVVACFRERGFAGRFHAPGKLEAGDLADAYRAMDVFAFASTSETQGIVITEAMAAGVPVVAIDSPGIREVVRDGWNGALITSEDREEFVRSLSRICRLAPDVRRVLSRNARRTARGFSEHRCAERALAEYRTIIRDGRRPRANGEGVFEEAKRVISAEWDILSNMAHAVGSAMSGAVSDEKI